MIQKLFQNKRNLFLLCSLLLVVVISYAGGSTYAKYVQANNGSGVVIAKEFYFTSDYLKPQSENAVYTLNPGTTSVKFELRNHADALRYSEDDINYSVTVSGEGTLSPSSGTITKGACNTANITLSNLTAGPSYIVTATGSAGYEETLKATFTVAQAGENVYKHLTQTNEYVLLTVWTENIFGTAQISFPDGLIPDNTDTIMNSVTNYSSGKYAGSTFTDNVNFQQAYSSKTYRFFKENTNDSFNIGSFDVTVRAKTAEASTP